MLCQLPICSGRIPDCSAVSSMPAIWCCRVHRSAASSDIPASGPSPRAYAEKASSTSASTRHGSGSGRASSRPTTIRLAPRGRRRRGRTACRAPEDRSARTRAGPSGRRPADPRCRSPGRGQGVLDVASRLRSGRLRIERTGLLDHLRQRGTVRGSAGATTATSSARRAYRRRPSSTAAAAIGDDDGSSTTPELPHPSAQYHRPPAATSSTTCAADNSTSRARARRPDRVPGRGIRRRTCGRTRLRRRRSPRSRVSALGRGGQFREVTSASPSSPSRSTRMTRPFHRGQR